MKARTPVILISTALLALAGAPAAFAAVVPPVTTSGSGSVTVSWSGTWSEYNETDGNVLHLCNSGPADCLVGGSGFDYFLMLPEGTPSVCLFEGMGVDNNLLSPPTAALPAGDYDIQVVHWASSVESAVGDLLPITISGNTCTPSGALPSWYQSYGRSSADEPCTEGWNPSWAQWTNDGAGGWVCNREQFWAGPARGWGFRSRAETPSAYR